MSFGISVAGVGSYFHGSSGFGQGFGGFGHYCHGGSFSSLNLNLGGGFGGGLGGGFGSTIGGAIAAPVEIAGGVVNGVVHGAEAIGRSIGHLLSGTTAPLSGCNLVGGGTSPVHLNVAVATNPGRHF